MKTKIRKQTECERLRAYVPQLLEHDYTEKQKTFRAEVLAHVNSCDDCSDYLVTLAEDKASRREVKLSKKPTQEELLWAEVEAWKATKRICKTCNPNDRGCYDACLHCYEGRHKS